MKLKSLPLGLLCAGMLLLASSQALAQNLVNNPGFESQMTGWSTSTGSAVYTATSNGALNGTYCAQGVEPGENSLGRLYQNFTGVLTVGKKYKISGWIKTQDTTGYGVSLALNYVDADGWSQAGHRVMEIAYAQGATDWTHYESPWFELPNMPVDAIALWLLFDFNAGAGTAFFDDVSLIQQPDVDDFVTTWKTDNPGTSSPTSLTVPMVGGPYEVDWDTDGNSDETGLNGPVTHDFGAAGTYTIRVRGDYDSIRFEDGGDKEKIVSLDQWGTRAWKSMAFAFQGAVNLQIPATDIPDFSATSDMSFMFSNAQSADPDTSGWDTSAVKNMEGMFEHAIAADPDTSSWETSLVTNMSTMFFSATIANPDTSSWNTAAVTNMHAMFNTTSSANPDTSGWDTSMVANLSYMFGNASAANPDVSKWDTSAVIFMEEMFAFASNANPDVSGWDTSSVELMNGMFQHASSFDQDLGAWDVMSLTNATDMFNGITLTSMHYESLLTGWNAQVLNAGVTFSGGNSTYCSSAAIAARDNMISSDGWVITDGGQFCNLIFKDGFEPLPPQLDCPCFNYDNAVAAARPDRLWFNCLNETDLRRKAIFSAEIADPFGYFDRIAPFDHVQVIIGGTGLGECYLDGDEFIHWVTDPDIPGDLERLENCASIIDDVIDEYTLECETDYYSCLKRVKTSDIVFEGDTVTINGVLINHPPESCLNNAPIAKVIWWWWDGPEVFEPNPNDGYVYTFPNSHTTSVPGSVAVDVIAYDATGRVIAAEIVSAHVR